MESDKYDYKFKILGSELGYYLIERKMVLLPKRLHFDNVIYLCKILYLYIQICTLDSVLEFIFTLQKLY